MFTEGDEVDPLAVTVAVCSPAAAENTLPPGFSLVFTAGIRDCDVSEADILLQKERGRFLYGRTTASQRFHFSLEVSFLTAHCSPAAPNI